MADPLVNLVSNVDNNIAYGRNDQRNPSSQAKSSSRRPPDVARDENDESPKGPDHSTDVQTGVGTHINREV